MKPNIFKTDRFKKARGGRSRLLRIACEKCGAQVCLYQKDGPGILKRMYIDRVSEPTTSMIAKELVCPSCKTILGVRTIYEKENRHAYRLFVGSVRKEIVKAKRAAVDDQGPA